MEQVTGAIEGVYLSRTQQRKQMPFCSLSHTLSTQADLLAWFIHSSVELLMQCSENWQEIWDSYFSKQNCDAEAFLSGVETL